jgi:hypothetical protein
MKKFFALILAISYIAASSRAVMNLHYCMDKLISWEFSQKHKAMRDNCGTEKKDQKGCCRDEHKVLQIDKDQRAAESFDQLSKIFAEQTFRLLLNCL